MFYFEECPPAVCNLNVIKNSMPHAKTITDFNKMYWKGNREKRTSIYKVSEKLSLTNPDLTKSFETHTYPRFMYDVYSDRYIPPSKIPRIDSFIKGQGIVLRYIETFVSYFLSYIFH